MGGKRDTGRLVMSKLLGRPLTSNEIVHHKDKDRTNNHLDNLELTDRSGHIRIHKPVLGYKFTEEQRKRLSESHKGKIPWNKGIKGFKHSDEAKLNMSKAQKGRIITWGEAISKSKTKVTYQELVQFIFEYPDCTQKDIMSHFGLKTRTAIYKHGGLTALKEKAKWR